MNRPPHPAEPTDPLVELQIWGERTDRRVRREHRRAQVAGRATATIRRHTADLREADWALLGIAMVTAITTSVLLVRFTPTP
jgi:hypothetical protein